MPSCKTLRFGSLLLVFCAAILSAAAFAQAPVIHDEIPATPISTIEAPHFPAWIRYSGTFQLQPGQNEIALTFSIYSDRTTSNALWQETQNVHPDANGNYSVLLGSTSSSGLPQAVFNSAEAQWLGVRAAGQPESGRALLVSVPYALKTLDAETLQGIPASDFVLRSEIPALLQKLSTEQNTASAPQTQTASFIPNAATVSTTSTSLEANTPTEVLFLRQDGTGLALQARGTTNTAVYALTTSTDTPNNTMYAGNFSTGGAGLRSEALASAGPGTGVWGVSLGSDGATGVLGETTQTTGFNYGVRGKSASNTGTGIFGLNYSTTGETTGVRGETRSPLGTAGVFDAAGGGKILSGRSSGVEKFGVDALGNVSTSGVVAAAAFAGDGSQLGNVNAGFLGGLPASAYATLASLIGPSSAGISSSQLQISPDTDPANPQYGFAGFVRDDLDTVHSSIRQAGSQMHFRLSRAIPDEAGIKDFLIAPYDFGMAIEYAGTIEVWSKNFSVHTNNTKILPVTGAQFWVGDQLDLGGLFVTANVNSISDPGNVVIAADRFSHASHGSMNFVTRNPDDSFRFSNGPLGLESMFGQVFKTPSSSNIEAYSGDLTASLLANTAQSAVQVGSRSTSRVDIITADSTPQLSVFPSGNVSIGNTNDTAKLAVGSSGQFQVSGDGAVTIGSGTPIVQHISVTATVSLTAVDPASCQVTSVTATGASDGDSVALGVPDALASSGDLVFFGWVTGPDIVNVRACNMGAASIASATGSVRVDVWKH